MLAHRACRAGCCFAATVLVAFLAAAPVRANAVTDWNVNATTALVVNAMQTPPVSTMHFAMVHGAIYDAVNSIDRQYEPYLVRVRARRWYSEDAAAATAAYRVLSNLVPAQQAGLDQLYATSLAAIPDGRAKAGGIAVGVIAAAAMLAARSDDGRFPANPYRFPAPASPVDPWPVGQWRPVLPLYVNDPFAWIKDVRPFLVPDPGSFQAGGPNALTSRRYAREFNEVKVLGSRTSSERSADQSASATFWAGGPIVWTRVARQLSTARELDVADSARLFARMYLNGSDAIIACWQDKARWLFWRPITAIQEADRDGNPATEADPNWVPFINTPPYPDHPSGLNCVGTALAATLADFFGDATTFSDTSNGVTREFGSFSGAVRDAIDARVWSGLHFRTADEDGAVIGLRVVRYTHNRFFQPAHGHGHQS